MTRRIAMIGLIAAVGLGAAWLLLGRPGVRQSVSESEAQRLADQFLANLRDNKPDVAWNQTTADFKSYRGKDVFRAFVKSKPVFKSNPPFESVTSETKDDRTVTVCHYGPSGKFGRLHIAVAFESNEWKVDAVTVD